MISLVGRNANTIVRTGRDVITIATIATGGIIADMIVWSDVMTAADIGMVIVATGNIAVVTGATPTATTTLRPSSNSSFDNCEKPLPSGRRLFASLKRYTKVILSRLQVSQRTARASRIGRGDPCMFHMS